MPLGFDTGLIKGVIMLAACAVGSLSLWLGYRLFQQGIYNPASFAAEGYQLKLTVSNAGPGVFFALFGAAMVIMAVTYPFVDHETTTTTTTTIADNSPAQAASDSTSGQLPAASGAASAVKAPPRRAIVTQVVKSHNVVRVTRGSDTSGYRLSN